MTIFFSESGREKQKYVELTASFAVEPEFSKQFDLMCGLHPYEKRMLDEEEDNIPIEVLRFVRRSDLLNIKNPWKREKSQSTGTKVEQRELKAFSSRDCGDLPKRDLTS